MSLNHTISKIVQLIIKLMILVIIGSGYTGISAAQESVSQKFKTLLIDQNALGEGASTRSAGMVSGGLNLGKKVDLFKEYGRSNSY